MPEKIPPDKIVNRRNVWNIAFLICIGFWIGVGALANKFIHYFFDF